jgi:DNA-binding NarL/FixJ family response regulator
VPTRSCQAATRRSSRAGRPRRRWRGARRAGGRRGSRSGSGTVPSAAGLTVIDPRAHATLLAATAATAATATPAAPAQPGPAAAPPAPPPDGLTQREAEILGLIARGLTNPEIAAQLFLSNHTNKTHISRIFAKTGSRDRAAAIGYAHRHNIG